MDRILIILLLTLQYFKVTILDELCSMFKLVNLYNVGLHNHCCLLLMMIDSRDTIHSINLLSTNHFFNLINLPLDKLS